MKRIQNKFLRIFPSVHIIYVHIYHICKDSAEYVRSKDIYSVCSTKSRSTIVIIRYLNVQYDNNAVDW